jgi:hypothetical protein
MDIRIREGDIHLLDIRTRMPFKYGIATMTRTPHAFVRLRVEIDGKVHAGIAADHLPPKWFTKDPDRTIEDEIDEMSRVIGHAVASAQDLRGESAFDVWRQMWDNQAAWGQQLPALLTHFGTSLTERALIEAVCRSLGQPFAQALRANHFGIRPEMVHSRLQRSSPADWLPERPLTQVIARHTVGLADPLTDADIAPEDRLDDGLPQSLEACARAYGLRHFKIKVNGSLDHDRERLRRIAAVTDAHAPIDYAFTLDGNEQFREVSAFQQYWSELTRTSGLASFFEHLLFVEQPFHRDVALLESAVGPLRDWADRPALIIDESDGGLTSAAEALRLGYSGTSHKNCKGVFKGVLNACLIASLRRERPGARFILSGEDLANIGPVALLQDLAVCAALGVRSVERNGHHYFAGLSMFPSEVQRQTLAAHGDLYHASRAGWPTLHIQEGALSLASVVQAPFGVGFEMNVKPYPLLDEYRG